MFVRDFIHVAQPFELVAPHFIADADWLNRLAEDAAVHARELSETLQLPPDDHADRNADEPVHCESGTVRVRRDSLIVPMVITGGAGDGLPPLEADLEVSPLGPTLSQLTLSATYRRTGADAADDAMVQRTAEVAARGFLQALAGRITSGETTC
jgi:hypothetical protein